ncbi:MAG: tetraacyldisaccharide 4'-kinase [Flavobacteriaceae bacterium]|nr:tetraacyldisaccharide 4'-kinase [Flavobacteriaceae bacterium]
MLFLRKILYPFSIIYDVVTSVRNFFFDKGIFKSKSYDLPILAVGNLCVGGTGKSPMIEYLVRLLKDEFRIATLSRGYRRKSEGFVLGRASSTADDLGDEPMQFYQKFSDINVAVDADRQNGISQLIQQVNPDVILLDDAFQHRKVTAGFYVLLTKYDSLFVDDLILPAGDLRESKRGAKRANSIVVTKCPKDISLEEQARIRKKINPLSSQQVFFTCISYAKDVIRGSESRLLTSLNSLKFTLVTGIANPKPLVKYLNGLNLNFEHISYKDHHNFSVKELKELSEKQLVITTEKDYMRLKDSLTNVFYLPIVTEFLNDKNDFNESVLSFVRT